jgi:hypothetical protein
MVSLVREECQELFTYLRTSPFGPLRTSPLAPYTPLSGTPLIHPLFLPPESFVFKKKNKNIDNRKQLTGTTRRWWLQITLLSRVCGLHLRSACSARGTKRRRLPLQRAYMFVNSVPTAAFWSRKFASSKK